MDYNAAMNGIAELPSFIRLADKLLSQDERADLINYLASHPKAGHVLEGTGGVRKLPLAPKGPGQEWWCTCHLLFP